MSDTPLTPEKFEVQPTKSRFASLLNDLYDMQQSPMYALRKQVLASAEHVILRLELDYTAQHAEIERLRQERDDAIDKREGAYMRVDDLKVQLTEAQATIARLESKQIGYQKALDECATTNNLASEKIDTLQSERTSVWREVMTELTQRSYAIGLNEPLRINHVQEFRRWCEAQAKKEEA